MSEFMRVGRAVLVVVAAVSGVACGGESGPGPSSSEPAGGTGTSGGADRAVTGPTVRGAAGGSGTESESGAGGGSESESGSGTGTGSSTGTSGGGAGKCEPDAACGGLTRCSDYSYGEDKCTLFCDCQASSDRLRCSMSCN